jgi:hypothetical protein
LVSQRSPHRICLASTAGGASRRRAICGAASWCYARPAPRCSQATASRPTTPGSPPASAPTGPASPPCR